MVEIKPDAKKWRGLKFEMFYVRVFIIKSDHMTRFHGFAPDVRVWWKTKGWKKKNPRCLQHLVLIILSIKQGFLFSLPPDNMWRRRRRRRLHALKRPPGNCSHMKVICGSDMGSERNDTWITVFIKSTRRAVSWRRTHLPNVNEGIINPATAAALVTPSKKRKIWWKQFFCFTQNQKKKWC